MNGVEPFVRHMLLCEDVQKNPKNPNKVDVLGLLSTLTASGSPSFPMCLPVLCIYLEVAAGRGAGQGHIVCRHADSGDIIFSSPIHSLTFPPDPLAIQGVLIRLAECVFQGVAFIGFSFVTIKKYSLNSP